jgi:hypothetical protein
MIKGVITAGFTLIIIAGVLGLLFFTATFLKWSLIVLTR